MGTGLRTVASPHVALMSLTTFCMLCLADTEASLVATEFHRCCRVRSCLRRLRSRLMSRSRMGQPAWKTRCVRCAWACRAVCVRAIHAPSILEGLVVTACASVAPTDRARNGHATPLRPELSAQRSAAVIYARRMDGGVRRGPLMAAAVAVLR